MQDTMIDLKKFELQSSHMTDIKTSVLYKSGQPALVTLDYYISTGNDVR
jgi:hypothetical protein